MAIAQIDPEQHRQQLQGLFWEYLSWANDRNAEHLGLRLDIQALQETDIADLGKYVPPRGLLLVAQADAQLLGCICLKTLDESMGELKRLYVRPAYRRQGIGSRLIEEAIVQASRLGFQTLRLDSARYMIDAQTLYQRVGFGFIEPYAESEIPSEYHPNWVFMELTLVS